MAPEESDEGIPDEQNRQLAEILLDIRSQISGLTRRIQSVEKPAHNRDVSEDSEGAEVAADNQPQREETEEAASPSSLREDARLMRQAAERLARLQIDDSDQEDELPISSRRAQGKKSGSLMLASDTVKKRIDWPHMYVRRTVGGKRRSVAYADLRVEEFVYGFLCMLENPKCKMDSKRMMTILRDMMQDTIDFTWQNALGFYEMVGVDVEYGVLLWSDTDRIKEMRMTYARTTFPDKKENKEGAKAQPKMAPAAMKCCAAYQKHACEHARDHLPFSHACSYCHRMFNTIARHPETDCFKRIAEEAKNAKRGE